MTTPKYQEIKSSSIPTVTLENKINIRIICGEYNGVKGPVKDVHVSTEYLDVNIPANTEFEYPVSEEKNVFAYIYDGGCHRITSYNVCYTKLLREAYASSQIVDKRLSNRNI